MAVGFYLSSKILEILAFFHFKYSRLILVNFDSLKSHTLLKFLDILLTIIHLLLIVFNVTGWIFPRTRKAHLVTIIATAASWFVLGIWYGMGYCPITDWQWRVKEKSGEINLPSSFIKYFADKITGHDFAPTLVNDLTLAFFLFAVICTVYTNFFLNRRKVKV